MDRAVDNPLSLNIPWEENQEALDAWKKVHLIQNLSTSFDVRRCSVF